MAKHEKDREKAGSFAPEVLSPSKTKELLRSREILSPQDLDLVYAALFHDLGSDALTLGEVDAVCKVALAKTRNMLIQCRYGLLGDQKLLAGTHKPRKTIKDRKERPIKIIMKGKIR